MMEFKINLSPGNNKKKLESQDSDLAFEEFFKWKIFVIWLCLRNSRQSKLLRVELSLTNISANIHTGLRAPVNVFYCKSKLLKNVLQGGVLLQVKILQAYQLGLELEANSHDRFISSIELIRSIGCPR